MYIVSIFAQLSISGYSHKQKVLLQKVLDQLFNFEFCPKRFDIIKEQLYRALKNFKAEQPYQHAVYYLALILTEQAWTKQELIDAVSCNDKKDILFLPNFIMINVFSFLCIAVISVERLEQFIRDFLSRMHVEALIHGNSNQSHAMKLASLVEQKLNLTQATTLPLLSRQLLMKREYKLVPGEIYRFETQNEFHKSSCVELYLQCGVQNDIANVHIDLASQILAEPCYNTLRTKEQLGYIVFCGSRKANGVQGIRFIVQSTRHPEYVEGRIELFLQGMTVCFYKK